MKIIIKDIETINLNQIITSEHIIASKDGVENITLAIRCGTYDNPEGWVAQIITPYSLTVINRYSGSGGDKDTPLLDLIRMLSDHEWYAFKTPHDFFTWAAEETS